MIYSPMCKRPTVSSCRSRLRQTCGASSNDRSLVELVGTLDKLADVQEALEGDAVNAEQLRLAAYDRNSGCTVRVPDERELAKVVAHAILHHRFAIFLGLCSSLLHDVKLVAHLALGHDHLLIPCNLNSEGICELRPFVGVHVRQEGHLREERVVLVPLVLSCLLNDVTERLSVERPT